MYNGHRSWNAWNVSLWIATHGRDRAAKIMADELAGQRTPDGARYNRTCIREAMRGLS